MEFDSVQDVSASVELAQHSGNYELAVPPAVLVLEGTEQGMATSGDIATGR